MHSESCENPLLWIEWIKFIINIIIIRQTQRFRCLPFRIDAHGIFRAYRDHVTRPLVGNRSRSRRNESVNPSWRATRHGGMLRLAARMSLWGISRPLSGRQRSHCSFPPPKGSSRIVNIIKSVYKVLFCMTPSPCQKSTLKMLILRPHLKITRQHKQDLKKASGGPWPPPSQHTAVKIVTIPDDP